jgi:D-alanyl-D-alanine carboxypeptidase/D-alanyl-D-alanine-endopeptidase (penicillin-binding protein 4)
LITVSVVTSRVRAGLAGGAASALLLTIVAACAGAGPEPSAADVVDVAALPGVQEPRVAADLLPAVGESAPVPAADTLNGLLAPLAAAPALGGSVAVDVVDLITGERLTQLGEDTARVPASTAKILTAAAALRALGPQRTLTTEVVAGTDGEVVLVGGGDILLAAGAGDAAAVNGHAGMADLARRTAAALKAQGKTEVSVGLDDSLFAGPAVSPAWRPTDVGNGFVAPVQAVSVDAGRAGSGKYARRVSDPAMAAARQFAAQLEEAGISVQGSPVRTTAPGDAEPLGQVESATVGDLVEYALTESDNTVSEVLGRLVAIEAGQPATFSGAGTAILAEVSEAGVPVTGATLADASGLGDGSLIAPVTLTGALALAASPEQPQLRPVLTGLPVAGVSGTLTERFDARSQRPAVGVVRAKTGTLSGVSSLAGILVDADGRLLAFAVLANGVQGGDPTLRALDSLVTTLARCGCR